MAVIRREDGTNAIKILVETNNQICLNAIDSLVEQHKESSGVATNSRVNHNGGYLIHFYGRQGAENFLPALETAVACHDGKAKIIVNHCPL